MAKSKKPKKPTVKSTVDVDKLLELVRSEVRRQLGPDATYEERRDKAAEVMSEVLRRDEERDLKEAVSESKVIEVEGKRYRKLKQSSSATYFGRWGSYPIKEALYREMGVRNGPTIKPIELRVGMIAQHMTPDLARIVGELSAEGSSREVAKTMRIVGLVPPSRAFLERRVKQMAGEIIEQIEALEEGAREATTLPAEVASVSVGLDRFSVRMSEPATSEREPPHRTEPYERTPPPPKEHRYHKAWVGSMTAYNKGGSELHTWRYSVEADADANTLAHRVATDVAWVLRKYPAIPVHCIQDGAPELRAMPEALADILPAVTPVQLVDFEHLAKDYLDEVVDACEPEGDPNNMKRWYRSELLRDDNAIDRIWRSLREKSKRLSGRNTQARKAVGAALSYIRKRKSKMRYASLHLANLPIGSGATEGTCWQMQRRVQRPGQSWETPGLRGTLAIRALVLSERWASAWKPYAATHRMEVRCVN
jgi:hypothetical protein